MNHHVDQARYKVATIHLPLLPECTGTKSGCYHAWPIVFVFEKPEIQRGQLIF